MFRSFVFAATIAAFGTFVFASTASASDLNKWKRSVAMKIAQKQTYPRSALSREIEGQAKVRIQVAANGEILNHEVIQPTGEEVLDREIPRLVKRLNPLPAIPSGQATSLVLPLTWALN